MTKGQCVAEAVVRRVPGVGLELRYALDGDLLISRVHRQTGTLAADAEGKRREIEARGWVAAMGPWMLSKRPPPGPSPHISCNPPRIARSTPIAQSPAFSVQLQNLAGPAGKHHATGANRLNVLQRGLTNPV